MRIKEQENVVSSLHADPSPGEAADISVVAGLYVKVQTVNCECSFLLSLLHFLSAASYRGQFTAGHPAPLTHRPPVFVSLQVTWSPSATSMPVKVSQEYVTRNHLFYT